jgi:putative phosphoesterase
MKIGIAADFHGNLPATKAVWDEIKDLELSIALGDMVGILGWPEETTHFVREKFDYHVYGNHDARIMRDYSFIPEDEYEKKEHRLVTSQMTEETIEWLSNLPEKETIKKIDIAHAHPYEKPYHGFPAKKYPRHYLDKKDWVSMASDYMDGETAMFGHTHDAGILNLDKFQGQSGTIINPGSVGAPWYKDAKYAIFDTDKEEGELHRVSYSEKKMKERFRQLGIN